MELAKKRKGLPRGSAGTWGRRLKAGGGAGGVSVEGGIGIVGRAVL